MVAAKVFRTPAGRAPVGPTPSLPNYESTSTSFEAGRSRADSFSQTGVSWRFRSALTQF